MRAAAVLCCTIEGVAFISMLTVLAGSLAVRGFARQVRMAPSVRPAVTVLKPLCGDEAGLLAALSSLCAQDYPEFQIVFGVCHAADPALAVVGQVRALFPAADVAIVIEPATHGTNNKVSNLINMLPFAKHGLLVCSDSDLHVSADYLDQIVLAIGVPGTGLVTTVCAGSAPSGQLAGRLGAMGITYSFLPGVLLSRRLGREDGLGTTMAFTHDVLARAGGFAALVMHLADDNVLAQRVQALGLRVGLANTVPLTSVPETRLRSLWLHELRWARTICALEPLLFAVSTLQFPMFWALLGLMAGGLAGGMTAWAGLSVVAAAWGIRAASAWYAGRALRLATPCGLPELMLLPVRDVLSVAEVVASYFGGRVVWRGIVLHADDGRADHPAPCPQPHLYAPSPEGRVALPQAGSEASG